MRRGRKAAGFIEERGPGYRKIKLYEERRTNMDDRKKLLESTRRGILRIMQMRTKSFLNVTLVFLVILWAGCLYAQERGTPRVRAMEAASRAQTVYVEPFGVPVSPAMYLVNFILLYVSKPEIAANMPAYRAALPQEVYQCLGENPEGCPYPDMAKYFAEQALEVEEAVETRTLSGQALARPTRDGKPWRHVNTDSLTRLTSHWGGRRPINSRSS